jgi:hypothetical protein
MRLALLIWCAVGAAAIGLKAHLDWTLLKYPDVAVRSGAETFFIPRETIGNREGWRADLMRLAGCWDAREAGVVRAVGLVADCGVQGLRLDVPARTLGPESEQVLRGEPLRVQFWPAYAPPLEHTAQLARAWAGKGEWVGRRVVSRPDWQMVQIVSPNSPWVHLLVREPRRGERAELERLYAGRCYRPEVLSDVGMTCSVALRVGAWAAVEYSLGPDQIIGFDAVRDGVSAEAGRWLSH